MKKIIIPAILAATVLVAGMFAFMPVEKASTVHTVIQTTTVPKIFELGSVAAGALATGEVFTIDCDADYTVIGITFDFGAGTYTDEVLDVTIGGNDVATDIPVDDGAVALLDGSEAADVDEDTEITLTMATDDGDEDIENARASVITSGDCEFD